MVIGPGEKQKGYALSSVFRCPPGTTTARAVGGLPDSYRELRDHGFDLTGYLSEAQQGVWS